MNEAQEAFWAQARSDHEIFLLLEGQAECHRLHYLQMCSEKLAKAHFHGTATPPNLESHAVLVLFFRNIQSRRTVRTVLGFKSQRSFVAYVDSVLPLADALQAMAPALTDGPNPEYPWPRDQPTVAPVRYTFQLWADLATTNRGRKFLSILRRLIDSFPQWAV